MFIFSYYKLSFVAGPTTEKAPIPSSSPNPQEDSAHLYNTPINIPQRFMMHLPIQKSDLFPS